MADVLAAARTALDAQADALAKTLRESPEAVRTAMQAAAPAALASLIGRGESDEGVVELRTALHEAQTGPDLLTALGSRLDGARLKGRAGGAGTRLLGGRGAALVEQLGPYAGVKPASASALVDLVVPVVLASLRRGASPPADEDAVRTLLRGQAEAVNRDLPPEFRPRFEIVLQPVPADATPAGGAGLKWLLLALALVILAAVAWWLLSGQAHAQTMTNAPLSERLAAWAAAERTRFASLFE